VNGRDGRKTSPEKQVFSSVRLSFLVGKYKNPSLGISGNKELSFLFSGLSPLS
jgi:hypothetical protein